MEKKQLSKISWHCPFKMLYTGVLQNRTDKISENLKTDSLRILDSKWSLIPVTGWSLSLKRPWNWGAHDSTVQWNFVDCKMEVRVKLMVSFQLICTWIYCLVKLSGSGKVSFCERKVSVKGGCPWKEVFRERKVSEKEDVREWKVPVKGRFPWNWSLVK